MAVVGQYDYPQSYYAWYIDGDDLVIVTNFPSDDNTFGYWVAPQETVTDGIKINYLAEPDAITAITDSIDLDNTLHKYVVEYVKSEMYRDETGKAIMQNNNDKAVLLKSMADEHARLAKNILEKQGMKKRDKVGGRRNMMPIDYR